MNERLKQIRSFFGLSRQAFGERLGCSGDVINNAERGRATVSDLFINVVCKTYNINEEWLRSGTGEMLNAPAKKDVVKDWLKKVDELPDDSTQVRTLKILAAFDASAWESVKTMMDLTVRELTD